MKHIFVVFFLFLIGFSGKSDACSIGPISREQKIAMSEKTIKEAEYIVDAYVLSTSKDNDDRRIGKAVIRVERVYKGNISGILEIYYTRGSSFCGLDLFPDQTRPLVIKKDENRLVSTSGVGTALDYEILLYFTTSNQPQQFLKKEPYLTKNNRFSKKSLSDEALILKIEKIIESCKGSKKLNKREKSYEDAHHYLPPHLGQGLNLSYSEPKIFMIDNHAYPVSNIRIPFDNGKRGGKKKYEPAYSPPIIRVSSYYLEMIDCEIHDIDNFYGEK